METTMTFKTSLSLIALMSVLAAPLAAQDDQTATDETTAEETTGDAPATDPNAFNMGEEVDENGNPVAQEPQVGQQYMREESGDWIVRCLKTEDGNDPCQLYQLLEDADGNAVAEISVVALSGGQAAAGATIVAPLGTLLTEQLTMRIDGGTARRFPFTACNQGGCFSRIGFTADDVAAFKRGAAATLRLVPLAAPDQEVVLNVSLTGFTAGFDSLAAE